MKRQFKAGAQAKREVKFLRGQVILTSERNVDLNKRIKNLKKEVEQHKQSRDFWYESYDKEIKVNLELTSDVWKLEKRIEQMQAQLDLKQDLINDYSKNERQTIDTILKQSKIIEEQGVLNFDMKFAYDNLKYNKDTLTALLIATWVCIVISWVW